MGCACGDAVEVFFDEPAPPIEAALGSSEPKEWRERTRIGGFAATLAPTPMLAASPATLALRGLTLLFLVGMLLLRLVLGMAIARSGPVGAAVTGAMLVLAIAGVAYAVVRARRPVSFTVADEHLEVARGDRRERIALGEIERITSGPSIGMARGLELRVHRRERTPLRVALPPTSALEAAFVAARLDAVVACGGRMETGYRGENLRVAFEEELDALEPDASEDTRKASRIA